MQFTRESIEAKESTLIQIAIAAAAVENPYRLYYGESDLPTPEFICRAAYEAMRAGHTSYTPTPGYLELRKTISEKFHELHAVEYRPTEVVVTAGACMAIFIAMRVMIGAGDNAIIISPAFSVFASAVAVFGGEVRAVSLSRNGDRFRLDVDRVRKAIDARTRCGRRDPENSLAIQAKPIQDCADSPRKALRRRTDSGCLEDLFHP